MFRKSWSSVTEEKHLGSLLTLTRDDELEETRAMVLEGGRVNVAGIAQKLNVSVFRIIRQPWVPQGLCKVGA